MSCKKETSNEDRAKIVDMYNNGVTIVNIAKVFQMPRTTISSIIKKFKTTGQIEKTIRGGERKNLFTSEQKEIICSWVEENCSVTLKDLKTKCFETFSIQCSEKSIERCLNEFHYNMKRTQNGSVQQHQKSSTTEGGPDRKSEESLSPPNKYLEIKMSCKKETSNADRERIVEMYNSGETIVGIARFFKMPRTTISSIIKKFKTTGQIEKALRGGERKKIFSTEQKDLICSWVDENCAITLKDLKIKCLQAFNIQCSEKSIERCLNEFHYNIKRVTNIPVRGNDERSLNDRVIYASKFLQVLSTIPEEKIIFIDEVAYSVSMRGRRSRPLTGTKGVNVVPGLRTQNISVCCAMNKSGIISRAYNSESFAEYMEYLCSELFAKTISNAIFILGNVHFHKATAAKSTAERYGHELMYLPLYSPFLNPIEEMFFKWEQRVRTQRASNENELLSYLNEISSLIIPADCAEYFNHMIGFLQRCINREEINE